MSSRGSSFFAGLGGICNGGFLTRSGADDCALDDDAALPLALDAVAGLEDFVVVATPYCDAKRGFT